MRHLLAVALLAGIGLVGNAAIAAPVDAARWNAFLDKYLVVGEDGINRVAYGKVTADDHDSLERYVDDLAAAGTDGLSSNEAFVFWVNLYNALTVNVILDHFPVESIKDIDISGLFADGPWGKELVTVDGRSLSLDDIEHGTLRKQWDDPRIHYAVNCASLGCPNLRPEAWQAETLDSDLDAAARDYVNSARGASVENGKLYVSRIYDWYQEDFGDSEEGVIRHLRKYADPPLAKSLETTSEIEGYRYDWSLNSVGGGS